MPVLRWLEDGFVPGLLADEPEPFPVAFFHKALMPLPAREAPAAVSLPKPFTVFMPAESAPCFRESQPDAIFPPSADAAPVIGRTGSVATSIAVPATLEAPLLIFPSAHSLALEAILPMLLLRSSLDISPAISDCIPALSVRMPVRMPFAFPTAFAPAQIITILPSILMIVLEETSKVGFKMIGTYIRNSRMEMTVAKTENSCTIKAIVHCLNFPPSSNEIVAATGGAIRNRNIRLKMRTMQFSRIVARLITKTAAQKYATR